MAAAPPLKLNEDEIDELLYLARANEADDLPTYLAEVQKLPQYEGASAADILCAAVDVQSGNSVLHYAAANGHSAVLDVIKKTLASAYASSDAYKSFVNLRNSSGNTALHWAALNGHLDAVKLLVSLGADAAVLNAAGHDAVYEAEQNDKNDVVSWLLVEGGALDTVVGALKEQEAGESSRDAAEDGEDVEMKMTMGDTSESGETGVEKGVESLKVDDSAKGKEREG
ncbi:ankyrin repeat-containing domain protein [Phyllosticta capitalensis]|uniref:Ankyrin repeat-containing domain protein n=1 Tax=Phyllosticta capitalensis TaxID=121624 RepID=A0ABR1YI24_9PEZI